MKIKFIRFLAYLKGLTLLIRPHIYLNWIKQPFAFISNTISLSKWISQLDKQNVLNDFYTSKREYLKRFMLYDHLVQKLALNSEAIDYLEFGVAGAHSFRWWLNNLSNPESRFYGFDTFEGLPESWGTFRKGDMAANIPEVNDNRAAFMKGLFQQTLPEFVRTGNLIQSRRKIIHMDADLFSSTIFVITSIAPYIKSGDIILFDEFNVPNHEFMAFKIFCDSYYIKYKFLGAVNNYLQVAFMLEK